MKCAGAEDEGRGEEVVEEGVCGVGVGGGEEPGEGHEGREDGEVEGHQEEGGDVTDAAFAAGGESGPGLGLGGGCAFDHFRGLVGKYSRS